MNRHNKFTMMKKLSIALIQLKVGKDKLNNLSHAAEKIKCAATERSKVDLIALPECFNSPYGVEHFRKNAENIPDGPTCLMLSKAAKEHQVYIVGGTIPESDVNKVYNTCTVWNPNGELIAKYRKMHLFDIDIPGKITFKESEILSAGDELVCFEANCVKIGLGICYDIRFSELAYLYRKAGCDFVIYPGAFNMTTGPMHWELLVRCRAVDNQYYVAAICPARGTQGYIAWGHSLIVDPWGAAKSLKADEDILYECVDVAKCKEVQQSIPVFDQRRNDIYDIVRKDNNNHTQI